MRVNSAVTWTEAEQTLWQHIRMKQIYGFKFRRQHSCEGFILDFACIELKLAVELDGAQHNESREKDTERTAIVESHGWKVLLFWNHEVLQEVDTVLSVIERYCQLSPNLPPDRVGVKPAIIITSIKDSNPI